MEAHASGALGAANQGRHARQEGRHGQGAHRAKDGAAAILSSHPLVAQVIAGADKGIVGTIIKVVTATGKCVVEGVNIRTKHIAPRTDSEKGSIKKSEYPIHHSNVMLYSKEKGVASRVGYKVDAEGKKVRGRVMRGVQQLHVIVPMLLASTSAS